MMPTLNEQNEIGQLVAGLSAAISGMRLYAEKHPKTVALQDQAYAGIAQRATSREKTTAMIVDDELLWDVSRDAGNLAFCGIGGVLLLWASAASLGLATAPTPLALVALVSGGFLIAIFVASGRKGLLRPR